MENLRTHRVKTQSRAALGMLRRAANEAEALSDQSLSDDLWELVHKLDRILASAERNRYQSPSKTI